MRFTYQYKSSDGIRHDGMIVAPSRESVFVVLKEKGVRPFNVELAPGFFNRVRSLGKRWLAITILAVVCTCLALAYIAALEDGRSLDPDSPLPRHQIYGEPALMNELARLGLTNVFAQAGDRCLARYSQPGQVVLPIPGFDPKCLASCLSAPMEFNPDDPREIVELKRIVLWMRDELREYLADGIGTPEGYYKRLNQRQREEISIVNRIRNELEGKSDQAAYDKANESLRRLGLPTILPPENNAKDFHTSPIDNRQ